tara:strand:- start:565 stop:690 length:126 start_codon:yes stop_codon:yes gene_type:complete
MEKQSIIEKSLKDFEDKHRLLSLWITLKIKIQLYWINLINK